LGVMRSVCVGNASGPGSRCQISRPSPVLGGATDFALDC
jgi:hypothetical protein